MNLCSPAMLYLVLSCISIVAGVMSKMSNKSLFAKGIYAILWTWILNFVCERGYPTLSWILVFLPFILMFGMVALVMDKSQNQSQNQTQTQTQTPQTASPTSQYQPAYPMLHR